MIEKIADQIEPDARRPFIHVARDDGPWRPVRDRFAQMGKLQLAALPPQSQMRAHHREITLGSAEIGHHGAPRLDAGQGQPFGIADVQPSRSKSALPCQPELGPSITFSDPQAGMGMKQGLRQNRGPRPETSVSLLQGHHIGIERGEHTDDPKRVALPIQPDGLADIVAYDPHHSTGAMRRATRAAIRVRTGRSSRSKSIFVALSRSRAASPRHPPRRSRLPSPR